MNSLRVFFDEMSRWEGGIKKWECIPDNKFVTVSVCYRSDREVVYSAIRKVGILLYEQKGMISSARKIQKKSGRKIVTRIRKLLMPLITIFAINDKGIPAGIPLSLKH